MTTQQETRTVPNSITTSYQQYFDRLCPPWLKSDVPPAGFDGTESEWSLLRSRARARFEQETALGYLQGLVQGYRPHELASGTTDGQTFINTSGMVERHDPQRMTPAEYAEAARWEADMRKVNLDYTV